MEEDMDFKSLEGQIELAARKAFTEMFEKYGSEGIYSFALYSDDGAMTVCPSTNTLKKLEEVDQEELPFYKFEPAEWQCEAEGAETEFGEICDLLREELEKIDDDDKAFYKFQKKLYETCVEVLEKLKSEDFFKQITGEDIFLNFVVSEYDFKDKEIKKIITTLNENAYKEEYFKWMKTWGK